MAKRQTVDESVGGDPATVELPPAVVEQQQGMFRDVYRAIGAVMLELARHGIGKTSVNQQQGYRFRGIDAVYNALSPAMVRAGLVVLPRMLSREWVERSTKSGTALFSVTVEAEFDFISIADGSSHTVKTYGEAMDSGDKATNKAMSAAYKYAAFQAFAIPTEGDNDADTQAHQPVPRSIAGQPLDGVWEALHADDQAWFTKLGVEVVSIYKDAGASDALDHINAQSLDTDGKAALWHVLKPESAIRTALTKEINRRKEAK